MMLGSGYRFLLIGLSLGVSPALCAYTAGEKVFEKKALTISAGWYGVLAIASGSYPFPETSSIAISPLTSPSLTLTGQSKPDQDIAIKAVESGEIMSFHLFRKKVEAKIKAKIIGEKLRYTNKGWIYEVRVKGRNGHVSSLVIDAKTAEIRTINSKVAKTIE